MTPPIVIKLDDVFKTPTPRLTGYIIMAPDIFPSNLPMKVYLANGTEKQVVVYGQDIGGSPEALKKRFHGFAYSGDTLEQSDLADTVLISNVPYVEALRIYQEYLQSRSDTR
jgi:hypothetical protein